jgi:hypothetical protein
MMKDETDVTPCNCDASTAYIYPSGQWEHIAIAFDEQELQSLVKILKKEGGPIAENLIQMFEIDQNDWACFSYHGRFICDMCDQEHIGIEMAKQIHEFLTKLLREKYPDCQSIIKKLGEKPISHTFEEMSDKYTGNHRYSLKEGEYAIIPNYGYLLSGFLFILRTHFQERIEWQKGGKPSSIDFDELAYILEKKHRKHRKHYQEYQNDLGTAERIIEKCKTGGKRISLTKDEHSWLRRMLDDKRRSVHLAMYETAYGSPEALEEHLVEGRKEMYHINKCLRALYPDEEFIDDLEDKINEVIDRCHYCKLDFNKIPPTFIKSVFQLGEHISRGSRCKICRHDAVENETDRIELLYQAHSEFLKLMDERSNKEEEND